MLPVPHIAVTSVAAAMNVVQYMREEEPRAIAFQLYSDEGGIWLFE